MYCKKCGTEQKEGQKFCPKCGEPFIEVNEKPHTNDFKQYAQKAADEFKKIDWNEKKEQTSSFIKEFINNPNKIGLATKVIACIFTLWILIKTGFSASLIWYLIIAAMLYVAFRGIPKTKMEGLKAQYTSTALCAILLLVTLFGTSTGGGNIFQNKPPQEEFLETIDKPETAYMVRIDKKVIRTSVGASKEEVPVGEGDSQDSFEWTLIFFPENETKTSGKAKLEPWCIDKNAWADGLKISYNYEIRDNRIELYNGESFSMYQYKWVNCKDMRLTIENGDEGIQLRGEFSDKERVFKLSHYRDLTNKDKHNRK